MAAAALLAAWPSTRVQAQAQEHTATPGQIEGRPGADQMSPLQARVDAAPAGARLTVEAGTYQGDLVIDKPLTLQGVGRPVLQGSGQGSVVRVRADDVAVVGFEIDGRGGGDLGRDSSGVHVTGARARIEDCVIHHALFGVYLREAPGALVRGNAIRGIREKAPGEKGSGVHVWNTDGFTLERNDVRDVRDGFYIQSSPNGRTFGNVAMDLRYGLHYMFSDDNVFEDNRFENGAAGAALMYSNRLTFRRNRFVSNRGFASVGLLFKTCDDVLAEDNLFANNARGVFMEGGARALFRRNVFAESDVALVIFDSTSASRFEGNAFVANQSPLQLIGRRTDTAFDGNYWSDHRQPDLDGDGVAERPYRLSNVFDHLRGNLAAADLFALGFAAAAVGAAEQAFPVLRVVPVADEHPLARPARLPDVPSALAQDAGASPAGLGLSALSLAAGAVVWNTGRRGRRFQRRQA